VTASAPGWLSVGRVTAPFGISGEVRVIVDTDFPERLAERPLFVGPEHRPMAVERARPHGREMLLKLAGVDTVEAADCRCDPSAAGALLLSPDRRLAGLYGRR
jgi:ribosomal 30S subunit maturation factor RimM